MVTPCTDRRETPRGAAPEIQRWDRAGFTMVEVIIAIMVLAVGLLGMAGTTALVVRQISLAEVTTERTVALQTTLEGLQAIPFDSVVAGSDSVGIFGIRWAVTAHSFGKSEWKVVDVITSGPGLSSVGSGFPMLRGNIPDTFTYRIVKP